MTELEKYQECSKKELPKLRYLKNEQIANNLYTVYSTVGVSREKYPENEEKVRLVKYIRENYADLTAPEFVFAFELWCKRKLDYSGEHFNNFSINFMEQVVISYRRFRAHLRSPQSRPYAEEDTYVPTPEEDWRLTVEDFKQAYERFMQGKFFWDFGGVKYAIIEPSYVGLLTEDHHKEINRRAEIMWMNEKEQSSKNDGRAFIRALEGNKKRDLAIKDYRHLVILEMWFGDVKAQGLDLLEVLETLKN